MHPRAWLRSSTPFAQISTFVSWTSQRFRWRKLFVKELEVLWDVQFLTTELLQPSPRLLAARAGNVRATSDLQKVLCRCSLHLCSHVPIFSLLFPNGFLCRLTPQAGSQRERVEALSAAVDTARAALAAASSASERVLAQVPSARFIHACNRLMPPDCARFSLCSPTCSSPSRIERRCCRHCCSRAC